MKTRIYILLLLGLSILPFIVKAQVPVALSPLAKQQFLSISGTPLAGGCIATFITGTSTPLATYTDGTGTAQNTNPIILDAGGFANIWLSNASYRFTVTSAGGVNCATGTFQYTVDKVSAYTVINQAQNIFLLGASSDPSGAAGELAYRSDIPCFRGFTTLWDCFVTLTATQTLTNKTFDISANTLKNSTNTAGNYPRNNGTQYVDSAIQPQDIPGTEVTITNAGVTGTLVGKIAKLSNAAPSTVVTVSSTDTGGAIGVCIAACGTTGSGVIQQSGLVSCTFDASGSVAGDYVQISPSTSGSCHDAGASYPVSGQVLGRVLSTVGAGNAPVDLFGPEITNLLGTKILNAQPNAAPLVGTGAPATMYTYTLPANTVTNLKAIKVTIGWSHSTGTASVIYSLSLNGIGTICSPAFATVGGQMATCTILNTGATTGTNTELASTSGGAVASAGTLTGLAWSSNQILLFTFNVANTDQVTPLLWLVESVQ